MTEQFLDGSVYIAAVGSAMQHVDCITSVLNIARRPGDKGPFISVATKGFEARSKHVDAFLASECDFILLLDHDQTFPADTLEKLRWHGRQFVSGLYMQRHVDPVIPIWRAPFEEFPARLWVDDIPTGRLCEIGATGWGCVLIHRSVFDAMAPLLRGEAFIIEDDMDIWPYELSEILAGRERVQVLRGDKSEIVGSDVRFGFFARQAGVKLWGDPRVQCGHAYTHMLSVEDYRRQDISTYRAEFERVYPTMQEQQRDRLKALDEQVRLGDLNEGFRRNE